MLLGGTKKARQAKAVQQAKQIGLALFTFDNDYGKFPGEKTVKAVSENADDGTTIAADSANDCFFQLVVAGYLEDVRVFSLKKNQPRIPAVGLRKLEDCFFAYLAGGSMTDPAARPVVVSPLIKGKKTFDPKPLGGKAVVLLLDMSVHLKDIDDQGRVTFNGKDLFDPKQDYWGGKEPDIKWPEK